MIIIIIWLLAYYIIAVEASERTIVESEITAPSIHPWSVIPITMDHGSSMVTREISFKSLKLFKKILPHGSNGIPHHIQEYFPDHWLDHTYVIDTVCSFWWDNNTLKIIGLFNEWNADYPVTFQKIPTKTPHDYILLKDNSMAFLFCKNTINEKLHYICRLLPVDHDLLQKTTTPSSKKTHPIKEIFKKYYPLIILLTIMIIMLIICIAFGKW